MHHVCALLFPRPRRWDPERDLILTRTYILAGNKIISPGHLLSAKWSPTPCFLWSLKPLSFLSCSSPGCAKRLLEHAPWFRWEAAWCMSLQWIGRLLCRRGTSSNSGLPQFLLWPGQSAPGPLYWNIFHPDPRLSVSSTGNRTLLLSWWGSPFVMGVPLSAPLTLQLLREHPNSFANIASAFASVIFLICPGCKERERSE